MKKFIIEKVSNMIFLSTEDLVFYAWDESTFTERKLNNAMNKIKKSYQNKVEFVRMF